MRKDLENMLNFLDSTEYRQAQEISQKSITEMVEMQDKAEKFDVLCELISGEYDSIHPAQLKHPIGLFLERLKEAVPDVW